MFKYSVAAFILWQLFLPIMASAEGSAHEINTIHLTKIITSKKLLENLDIKFVDGMVFIEDIMESISGMNKISLKLIS